MQNPPPAGRRRAAAILILFAATVAGLAASTRAAVVEPQVYEELSAAADARASVIVLLAPAADLATAKPAEARSRIAAAQGRVLAGLTAADFEPRYVFDVVPVITGRASFAGLQKLAAHADVLGVGVDLPVRAHLDGSVPFIHADDVHAAGITGRGVTVAVLDSGIDTDHVDLSDDIAPGAWHFLGGGSNQGPGAEDDNGHGTNVSGIITSRGLATSVGVAPDAAILAVKVLDEFGSGLLSDWIAGINYVVSHADDYDHLSAINMSLGTFALYGGCPCDNQNSTLQAAQAALQSAKNAGIVTFASSGNDGSTNAMGAPACLSAAVAVAAVYEANLGREPDAGTYAAGCFDASTQAEKITCFSNRSPCNELAAPGRNIAAPGVGGGTSFYTGTSQAAPHCAGVAALMTQQADSTGNALTPDQIVQIMKDTGVATVDPASTTPNPIRVDALNAIVTTPPEPVTLDGLSPASGYVGTTVQLVLVGSNFSVWHTVDVGPGVTMVDATPVAPETLLVELSIDAEATPSVRDVLVSDAFGSDTLTDAFEVLATLRHYVSPAGGNVYPYHTPASAALTITNAIGAAAAGDSILVDSTAVSSSFTIDKGVIVYGGWTDGFTSRDVDTIKTVLNLSGNVVIEALSGVAGIDGFVLQGGSGTSDVVPLAGNYGGALRIQNTTAVVANCWIRNNDANTGAGFGGGGGIFVRSSTVTLDGNRIENNAATRGGAIYLYGASGIVSNNTITGNTVAIGGITDPTGAGVAIENCAGVTLTDNAITSNGGAKDGGGVWISNATGVELQGGSVRQHAVTSVGGGVYVSSSDATLQGAELRSNSAGFAGGGVATFDTSSVTISGCRFFSGSAVLGGGVYAPGGDLFLRHNVLVQNTAGAGGGAYVGMLGAGEVTGNTLDRNGGTGAIAFGGTTLAAFDNIVTNSTGDGIFCNAGGVTLTYNLVWNSGGNDYNGCSPGVGSLSAPPVFADTTLDDYHLALHSPAIDAGRPGATWQDPDGSRGDMGAYGSHAFVMDQPAFPANVVAQEIAGQAILRWDANPEPDVAAYAVYCDSTSGFVPSLQTFVISTPDTTVDLGAAVDTLYCRVSAVDSSGYAGGFSAEIVFVPNPMSPVPDFAYRDRLDQNAPNPFNPRTAITFAIARPARVQLSVYDVAGRPVRRLVDAQLDPGEHRASWDGRQDDGRPAASGHYYYRLDVDGAIRTRKMVLLK
jgi:subtilisin family serine protease